MKQKHTSTRIATLLDLYFSGQTSLEQEKELQQYFTSEYIAPEYRNLAPLFQYIADEKEKDKKEDSNLPFVAKKQKTWWYYTAISAAVLVLFFSISGLFFKAYRADYKLILQGVEVHDQQLALHLAREKMGKIDKVLERAGIQAGKVLQTSAIQNNPTINKHLEKIGILEKTR